MSRRTSTEKELETSHVEKEGSLSSEASNNRDEEEANDSRRDWTPEEERNLVYVHLYLWRSPSDQTPRWKIDFRVFPMLCIVFGLSLLDRTNISAAYIVGLAADLDLAVGAR